ncbi:MAG: HAD-IIIA family hydrolase [Treponema sp.]|nr:HAD-IIIA family hydrolase [Treponema sp.]
MEHIKTVIMAGGKGTRIASAAAGIPKPMIRINDKPILEYQLECLANNNLRDVIIVTGYLGSIISDYFGDGRKFGLSVSYFHEETPLGTAGALFKLKDKLTQDFLLLNGDIIFDVELKRIIDCHFKNNALATLAVHPNSHPFDSALIITDHDCRVTGWLNKEDPRLYYKNQVNAGIHIINRELLLQTEPRQEQVDLDRDILKPSVKTGRLFAYHTPEYIMDIGTPDRLGRVTADLKNNIVQKKNLAVKQEAVFLDRDGTINVSNGFIGRPEDLILAANAAKAIKIINDSGYLAIVITNQPVIARGETDFETLEKIHMKMETDLGMEGAYIDDLFFCPHHPDKGYAGERPEYKIDCDCRKPKPGLILQAARKYNIDLPHSFMVGDDMRDAGAGINAGCTPVFLSGQAAAPDPGNVKTYKSLYDFALDFEVTQKIKAAK